MTEKRPKAVPEETGKSAREARLAEALRTNLAKRKAQDRARKGRSRAKAPAPAPPNPAQPKE